MSLQEQIESARRPMSEWPEWMRQTAHFTGSEDAPLPDNAED